MGPIVDAIGQALETRSYRRIVSLVPSLTETLFALGAGDRVAGVTRYCTKPEEQLAGLPRVGGTKNPDLAAIVSLVPDLVVASMEENRKEDVETLLGQGLRVYVTLPTSVDGALAMLADLAALVEVRDAARPLLDTARDTLSEARRAAREHAPVRYFCPIWRRPYMVPGPGTYAYDLLATCGGLSACGAGDARYFVVDLQTVAERRPEVVLLPDEPYPFAERHKADFRAFPAMPAVQRDAIFCVDGKALTWYGPRLPAALRLFSRLLAPSDAAVRD